MNTLDVLSYFARRNLGSATLILGASCLLNLNPVHAMGADSDGFITPTTPLFFIYHNHERTRQMYANGAVVSHDAQLRADVTLLRALYPFKLSDNVVWTPNLLLPVVHSRSGGDLSGLGSAHGLGDLAFVSGFQFPLGDRAHLAVVPFVWFPTGKYDRNSALNPGQNRYRVALQIGWHLPLGRSPFDLTGSFDITRFGRNKDTDTKQSAEMEWNGWIKYNLPSARSSNISLGLAHVYGGEITILGTRQNNRIRTTTAKIQFGTWLDSSNSNHMLFTFARDLNVKNGLRVKQHFELRFLHSF